MPTKEEVKQFLLKTGYTEYRENLFTKNNPKPFSEGATRYRLTDNSVKKEIAHISDDIYRRVVWKRYKSQFYSNVILNKRINGLER